ncbi:MAG: transporter substrate-binding domain-containing protein [Clostridia bacterium]|nr:transporter substrate-binding domain-containing protein [Clostridia bacterium]
MKKRKAARYFGRFFSVILVTVILAASLTFIASGADGDTGETVRVGWYESAFNTKDENGRRSGYAYEYERKIAAYTGWNYEYVEGNWPDLLQKLKNGEIDMLAEVSFKEDRAEYLLYSTLPMGTESYHLYVMTGDTKIKSDDVTTLNGKTVGVMKNSIQEQIFDEWLTKHDLEVEVIRLTGSDDESFTMLAAGRLDAYVAADSFDDPDKHAPLYKIGSSEYYFAVNKSRTDLFVKLESALSRIQDENRYYNEQLYEKYLKREETLYVTAEEFAWLDNHGTVRVGYQDNYLAFCASDPETGELTGALKDYLEYATTALENAVIRFETVAYPTASAAIEALKNGEIDCMFPANFNDHDSEQLGIAISPAMMRTEMDAVVRADEQKEFIRKKQVTVAVNEGNPNYEMFLAEHYPGWLIASFKDSPACLDAIAEGKADCLIISNYRFSNISKQCEKLHLTTVYTGVDMDYCLALRQGDTVLYSIMSRVIKAVPTSVANASLTYYSTEDAKIGFIDFIKDNIVVILIGVVVIVAIILGLLINSIRAQKKVTEEEHIVNDLNRKVFVDALTSVRNKGSFNNFIEDLQDRIDNGEELNFAIGVCDCDNLKKINDNNGHDKGDEYLKAASSLICGIFLHSPVFRIGGDEFAIVLMNEDYKNREELLRWFESAQKDKNESAKHDWETVSVAIGVADYDPNIDSSVNDTARRADKIMYENKRLKKAQRG